MSPTWVGIFGDVAPTVMNGIFAAWKVGPGREDGVGVRVADEQRDLVLLDELLRRLGRDVHLVLAVVDDEVDLLAEHAAGGVDLLDRQLGAVRGRQVERGLVAGQGEAATDLDRAAGPGAGRRRTGAGRGRGRRRRGRRWGARTAGRVAARGDERDDRHERESTRELGAHHASSNPDPGVNDTSQRRQGSAGARSRTVLRGVVSPGSSG